MRKFITLLFAVSIFFTAGFFPGYAQDKNNTGVKTSETKAIITIKRDPGIVDIDNRKIPLKIEQEGTPFLSPNAVVSESFDGTTFPPSGWTSFLVSGTNTWTRVTSGTSPTQTPHSGVGEAKFNSYDADGGVRALITPAYDLSGRGANTPTVSLWMYRDAGYAGTLDKVDLYMNTSANLTGATLLGTVNRAMGSAPIVASEGWYQYSFNVPAGFNTITNYFIIQGTSVYGNNIYIDDVSWVTYPGTSPALTVNPLSLSFGYVPVGGTSVVKADTLWGAYLTGFPSNIVVTAPAGFEVCLTLGGTYTSSVNVSYTSATLNATTIYSRFKPTILQSYTGNITNAGGGAPTVNVAVTGTAYLYAAYCTSNATYTEDEDIFNVTLGTLNNSSTCATTGGIGSILNEYSNYTTTVAAPNIQAGGSIPFSVTSGTCGGSYSNAFKIFIDFNQNGSFLDAGEEVYVSPVSTSGPHTETGYISVPSGATIGNTMMRVIDVETGTPSGITSCGTYGWGETEDYTVNITPPPANDVGMLSIDIPDVSYPGNFTPQATVKNFGSATQTFNVTMVISPGAYTSTQTVTGLASGLTQQVNFSSLLGAVGSYNVTVYTQLNPDANMTNDTMRKVINFSNGLWISGLAATTGTYMGTGVGYTRNDSGWVFSMGGNSTLGTEVNKYNVLANTWAAMASLPAKRVVSSSALLKDSIYVIAGSTDGTNYLNTVVKYDINANTWSTLTSTLPVLLGWGKSAGYQDSLIYCAGGLVGGVPVSTVYLYSVNTNSWRAATSLPAARFGGAMAISGDTIVYVGGADALLLYATTYRGVISQTDRSVITWTTGTNYPGGTRYRFDAAPMGIGKGIMVAGGSPSAAWTAINDAYSYSPGLDKWTRRFNKTTAVLGGSVGSVYIGNNNWRFVVVSGYTGSAISTVTELYADTISTYTSPLTGIKTIPGNYPTILAAVNALNAAGVGIGGVTFNIAANYTETIPPGGYVINDTISPPNASNPVVFQKSGSGANPLVTSDAAGSGIIGGTTLGSNGSAFFKLIGTDFITFNGFTIQELYTGATQNLKMQYGFELVRSSDTNGCKNVTISNCVINMQQTNISSCGIATLNVNAAHTTTSPTTISGRHENISVQGCTISNSFNGMYFGGYGDLIVPYNLYDNSYNIGTTTGNNLVNIGSGLGATNTNTHYGMYGIYLDSVKINNNTIRVNTGTNGATSYGMFLSAGLNSFVDIIGNTVSDTAGGLTNQICSCSSVYPDT